MIDVLVETYALKDLPRSGWENAGIVSGETVAAHTWGVSWLLMLLLPSDLNRERALQYAILHDLPEVRTGDLTPSDGVSPSDKRAREEAAMEGLCRILPDGQRIAQLWRDFELCTDEEADFVHQLDKLDMALQAVTYAERGHGGMREFLESAAVDVNHPTLRPLMIQLLRRVVTNP
ncbi:MAG: HD domain-containing protein, partial [Proteobacteria bacterium]|nr:HD domain-containing protein [Pseudomonadota bacterium]